MGVHCKEQSIILRLASAPKSRLSRLFSTDIDWLLYYKDSLAAWKSNSEEILTL